MSWSPNFRIYASDGVTLVYSLETVVEITGWPKDEPSNIELTNLRSQGSIVIPGGDKAYDITIRGRLSGNYYADLTTAMFDLKDTIQSNTRYVLKIDKSESTVDDINVMRLTPIVWDESRGNRRSFVYYTLTLRANCWQ